MTRRKTMISEEVETAPEPEHGQDPDAPEPSDPATNPDDGDGENDDAAPPDGNESARAGKVREVDAE